MASDAERKARSVRGFARRRAVIRFLSLHGTLFVLMVLYSLAGAYAFMRLEAPFEAQTRDDRQAAMQDLQAARARLLAVVHQKGKVDAKNWSALVGESLGSFEKAIEVAVKQEPPEDAERRPKWDFWGALYYASTIYTTIGYGNMAPTTTAGRVATIIYAVFGIPLCLVLLANLGGVVASAIQSLITFVSRSLEKPKRKRSHMATEDSRPKESSALQGWLALIVVSVISGCYIGLGICLYRCWEDWTHLEAFYFIFISLTTIGFGDVVPLKPKHFMLSSLYVFVGLTLISTALSIIQGIMAGKVEAVKERAESVLGLSSQDSPPAQHGQVPLTSDQAGAASQASGS